MSKVELKKRYFIAHSEEVLNKCLAANYACFRVEKCENFIFYTYYNAYEGLSLLRSWATELADDIVKKLFPEDCE